MALINEENKYIKMMSYGGFSIYPDEETRLKQKAAPSVEDVLNRYQSEMTGYNSWIIYYFETYLEDNCITREEFDALPDNEKQIILDAVQERYPAVKTMIEYVNGYERERNDYLNDVALGHGAQHSYPLMEEFYEKVADSVPDVIEGGQIPMDIEDVAQVYEAVKEHLNFGETRDA